MDIICNVGRILQKSANIGVASSRVHQKQQTEKGEWLAVASFKQAVRQSASLFREITVCIQHTRKQPAATGNCNAPQVLLHYSWNININNRGETYTAGWWRFAISGKAPQADAKDSRAAATRKGAAAFFIAVCIGLVWFRKSKNSYSMISCVL